MSMLRSNRLDRLEVVLLSVLVLQLGCRHEPEEGAAPATGIVTPPLLPDLEPASILQQMEQVYREADCYSDRGQVVLRYRERGDIRSDAAPLAVSVRLPNHLRVNAYYSELVSDGNLLRARIADEKSNDIDGQVLSREPIGDLTLEQIYQDVTLREAMTSGMGGQSLQLNLLYADDPLKSVFAEDAKLRLLGQTEYDGGTCYRVVAEGAEGEFVFWIDGATFLLRRLDYPATALLPELAKSEIIQDLSLRVEFRDATFDPAFDDSTFRLDVPAEAKLVRAFVLPPHPLPTTLFGKQANDFTCYTLDGSQVSQKSLLGKTAVLMWFNDHPACRATIEQLSEVYATRSDDDGLAFFAVSTEPTRISNGQLEANLAGWNAALPLLRDLDACGRDVLGVPYTPTMIVLDKEGYVQIFEVGANSDLAQELPTILDRLREGDDLASEILADHDDQLASYQQTLKAAMAVAGTQVPELAPASREPPSAASSDSTTGELER